MSHKRAIEILDRTLQDIKYITNIMGGMTLVLTGDFRQCLSAITRATRAGQINACLKESYLWDHVQKLCFPVNMRMHLNINDADGELATHLLNVGN